MATLQAGQTVSIQLAEGESYTVTPSGTAQVSTRGVSGSELSAPRTLTSAQTFGPYSEAGVLNIACLVGTASYGAFSGIAVTATGVASVDAAAIQAAIDSAEAAGGGTVDLYGTFQLLALQDGSLSRYVAVKLKSNVNLRGVPGQTKLRLASSAEPTGWGGHVLFGENVSNIRVEGIEIDGNRAAFTSPAFAVSQDGIAGSNIRILDCVDVTVENCYSHSAIYHGFFTLDGCRRINARRNKFSNCGYRAMHFNGTDGAGNDITDCSFDENDCWSNGQAADNPTNGGIFIALGSSYRISCRGNTVKDDPGCGIEITGTGPGVTSIAREIVVIGNRITACENGIRTANNLTNAIISGNTISDSTATGIALGSMTACRVEGNIVRRGATMALTVGNNATDATVGCSICNNTFFDNHGDATQRAALLIQAGAHIALQINNNAFINNGATDNNVCTAINMIDPASNRTKSLQIVGNLFRNNKGHGILLYDTDDAMVCDNTFMDNYEATGPRGRAIWVRGTADRTLVSGNKAVNDNVTNSLEQVQFDATTTNSRCYMNEMECAAGNKFIGAVGATGLAHSNTGTASWPVGFTTGTSAV